MSRIVAKWRNRLKLSCCDIEREKEKNNRRTLRLIEQKRLLWSRFPGYGLLITVLLLLLLLAQTKPLFLF